MVPAMMMTATALRRPRLSGDSAARREKLGLRPMTFGLAGYVIVRDTEQEAKR